MTKKTYTFNECYAILGVDPKTFRRWLKKADIDPDAQKSRLDERIRYLTQEQIEQLATDHERTLVPLEEAHASTDSVPSSTYKRHLEELEERVENLRTLSERHGHMVLNLSAKIEHQAERISKLEEQLSEAQETIATLQAPKRATKAKSMPVSTDEIPEGLVSWRTFANLHRMPQTTVRNHIRQGYIPIVEGRWKVGNGYVTEVLDAKGRREFWVQYHKKEGFGSCDDCPHNIEAGFERERNGNETGIGQEQGGNETGIEQQGEL